MLYMEQLLHDADEVLFLKVLNSTHCLNKLFPRHKYLIMAASHIANYQFAAIAYIKTPLLSFSSIVTLGSNCACCWFGHPNVTVIPKVFNRLTAYCFLSGIFVFHVRLSCG